MISTRRLRISALKQQARRLRTALHNDGHAVSHSRALELLARQLGYRDWNGLHAATAAEPDALFHVGERVAGRYFGQPFHGRVRCVRLLSRPDRLKVTIDTDEAVDTVTSAAFSNKRRRLSAVIDGQGRSVEKTGDGQPHMTVTRTP